MKTAFINGKIHTIDDKKTVVEAILVEDGIILMTGTTDEIMSNKNEAEIIDLEQRTVLPGLNDSHMHLLSYGFTKKAVNLENCHSIDEVLKTISEYIKNNNKKDDHWLECYGWNEDNWYEKRSLNRNDLDKISSTIPIFCTRICGHVNSVNSLALEKLGLDETTEQPKDGSFEVDENGKPTGLLVEMMHNIYDMVPNPSVEELKELLMAASIDASKAGITSVQTDDFENLPGRNYNDVIKAYEELVVEKKLSVRVNEQCALVTPERFNQFYNDGHYFGEGDTMFKIGPLKLYADGSLGSRTAWLKADYSDMEGEKGFGVFDNDDDINLLVKKAHDKGMDVAVHCIGDAATTQIVTAIEHAIEDNPNFDHRHGVVHAQILTEDLCKRFQQSNILAFIQPIFIEYDLHMAEGRVGKERMKTSYNWRTLNNAGVKIPMGTDCPVESFNPFANIFCAVTRKDLDCYPEEGWYIHEALTLDEAIENYTKTPAFASREEDKKGSIEVGKLADFTVLDRDIYGISKDEIKDVTPVMTVLGGKIVYTLQQNITN